MPRQTQDLLNRLVMAIDRRQRQRMDIWEFSDDPHCILRLGLTTAHTRVELGDGTAIEPGDTVGAFHFWNEQIPRTPPGGPDLTWANEFKQSFVHSFQLLATHVEENPALADIQAFSGGLPLAYTPATIRLLRRLGLEVFDPICPQGLTSRAADLGMRLWAWLLRRAFNPESMRGLHPGDLQYRSVWISRRALVALHGSGNPPPNRSR